MQRNITIGKSKFLQEGGHRFRILTREEKEDLCIKDNSEDEDQHQCCVWCCMKLSYWQKSTKEQQENKSMQCTHKPKPKKCEHSVMKFVSFEIDEKDSEKAYAYYVCEECGKSKQKETYKLEEVDQWDINEEGNSLTVNDNDPEEIAELTGQQLRKLPTKKRRNK